MISKKVVIHLVGHSCAGKSSVEKVLKEKLPGAYVVASDKQKWHLAGYNREKDGDVIKEITKGLFEVVCKLGNPIILIAKMSTEAEFNSYKEIANRYGYEFIFVELTAPKEVLLERFRERVEKARLANSTTISVTSEDVFLENLEKPNFIPFQIPSFDTSMLSSEDIANKILALI